MAINPLSSNLINLLAQEPVASKAAPTASAGVSFSDVLSESMNTAAETDVADKASALELLSGQTDDMSGLLLDAQKAEIALQLALQLRNKVVDAYNEIMRMQV